MVFNAIFINYFTNGSVEILPYNQRKDRKTQRRKE